VKQFETRLNAWLQVKSSGDIKELGTFYAADFNNSGKSLADWLPTLEREVSQSKGRALNLKDLTLLQWVDTEQTMVVTFGEVAAGQRTGHTKRQYWSRSGNQWKIFYEGLI